MRPGPARRPWTFPARFRTVAEDRLRREPSGVAAQTRWVHLTREIERVLKPLAVLGIHLQRDQTREILALRKPAKVAARIRSFSLPPVGPTRYCCGSEIAGDSMIAERVKQIGMSPTLRVAALWRAS